MADKGSPAFRASQQHKATTAGIHIKPSHKGLLDKDLGVPLSQPIPKAKIEAATHSSDPAVKKRAVFAQNFGHKKP